MQIPREVRTRALVTALITSWLLAVAWPTPAAACSCAELAAGEAVREARHSNDHLTMLGRTVDREDAGQDSYRWTVEVERTWGGVLPAVTEVTANRTEASCGIATPSGTTVAWHLYGGATSGQWQTGLCQVLSADDLRATRGGQEPVPLDAEAVPPLQVRPVWLDRLPVALGLIVLGAAAAGALWRSAHRPTDGNEGPSDGR